MEAGAAEVGIDGWRNDLDNFDTAGSNFAGSNSVGCELVAEREREGVQRGFAGAVERHGGNGNESQAAGHVDDDRIVLFFEVRDKKFSEVDGRFQVDRQLFMGACPGFGLGLGEVEIAALDAGVVGEDVEIREFTCGPFEESHAGGGIGEIADAGMQLGMQSAGFIKLVGAASADDDLRAGAEETLGESETDAGGAAGDEDSATPSQPAPGWPGTPVSEWRRMSQSYHGEEIARNAKTVKESKLKGRALPGIGAD